MSDAGETRRRVKQNTGVLGDARPGDKQVINAEIIPPGTFGHTEGGMPEGTPPVAPTSTVLEEDVMMVEDTEEDLGVPEPAFSDLPPPSE